MWPSLSAAFTVRASNVDGLSWLVPSWVSLGSLFQIFNDFISDELWILKSSDGKYPTQVDRNKQKKYKPFRQEVNDGVFSRILSVFLQFMI